MLNYTYDTKSEKEKITHIDICYGKPIYVSPNDNAIDKLNEYTEAVSIMRYEAIEEKGVFKRSEITNSDYINYLKGNLANLELGKIDVDVERAGIQGSQDEFYLFHHINHIPFDKFGRLLDTDEVRMIRKISAKHGIYLR